MPSTVVTLLVTPTDAERIALASTEGSIMLALRNPLDVDADRDQGHAAWPHCWARPNRRRSFVWRRACPRRRAAAAAAATAARDLSVETIRAAKRVSEVVK